MLKRISLCSLAAVSLALAISPPLAAADAIFPSTISVPNGFRPEGIAVGRGATMYCGSIGTGAVFAADLVTGQGSVLVPPQPGRAAIGLSFDARTDIIYVAGGPTGQGYAYDAHTGATVAVFQLTTITPTFVNDQVVTADAVYFTESMRAVVYRVPLSRGGRPSPDATVTEIPLGGDFVQVAGTINSNGIVATPAGRSLIIINSALGALFRVDPSTGNATKIDLGGANVNAGDGLLLRGDQLFVVQNRLNQIAVIELDARFERGTVGQLITSPRFDVPTTIDTFGGALYVVNARFSTPPTADTTYTIERVSGDD